MFKNDEFNVYDVGESNWLEFWKLTNEVLNTNYPETLFNYFDERKHLVQIYKIVEVNGEIIAGVKAYSITSLTDTQHQKSKIIPFATYIETIVVVNKYRGKGIGTYLLRLIEQESLTCFIKKIALHTPINNSRVIDWYLKQGFCIQNIVEDYYRATTLDSRYSQDAFLFEKDI
ncbi:similar to Saccharomyces cerevisiae YOR253W NAT5 Subunit of the N-terminal acetyltransferase NatA (Nat1p, Ard1p, Nat5p) [Maudiozyma saulgeensis]|uniref:Similar to Saccharomyces cerevisiae YOR253W NAT5 Subunit of the N-terminal acetyltransferase NatA (Nat1p, Ard1p, Nat5p) n=1 Tax=Maudiozyma saulgeensis TaxID=1789683 RepID=A0A1X7R8V2_9SACH|nr:similar to Saccharomyces cerevisiae YOR253W NAT5 Subunit of the N-terminal acetyltransferase NatA (Nat1p, Ard1p, Nat5p) [Kazachstania saulgeensis]